MGNLSAVKKTYGLLESMAIMNTIQNRVCSQESQTAHLQEAKTSETSVQENLISPAVHFYNRNHVQFNQETRLQKLLTKTGIEIYGNYSNFPGVDILCLVLEYKS